MRPKSWLQRQRERGQALPRPPDQAKRPSSSAQGYGRRWRRLRLMILRRDPLCCMCKRELSTQVDHIMAKSRGGTDDESNLRGLCAPCHSRKTVAEDGALRPRPHGAP